MISRALRLNFMPQFPEITVSGLSANTFAGLLSTFKKGESGFIASSPGNSLGSFLVSTAAAIRALSSEPITAAAPPARLSRLQLMLRK